MARFGIVGGSYTSQAVNLDCQSTINWYQENDESGQGKSAAALYPTPGTKAFCTLNERAVPGLYEFNGRCFAAGSAFYEIFANGTSTKRGDLTAPSPNVPIQIVGSETQLLILSTGLLWVYDLTANTVTAVPNFKDGVTGLPQFSQIGYSDGFFIALQANSQTFYVSDILNALSWDAAMEGTVSEFPDNIVGMSVDHRQLIFGGRKKTVFYQNTGNLDFPFSPIQGAYVEAGWAATYAQAILDNTTFYIAADERGQGVGYRVNGYSGTRISNHGVELAWQSYPTISDAVGFAYQDQGHTFWQIWFPSANKTWLYDVATNLWFERTFLQNGNPVAHKAMSHCFFNGKHLVGDRLSGNIYEMSLKYYDDDGSPIKRVRRAPHISNEQEWIFYHQLQIDLESGLGPEPPLTDSQGPRDPIVMLRWSDDGGHTWSNEQQMGAGQGGEYKKRVIMRRMGRSRDRVFEISTTDPIGWRIIDAYLDASPGFQPQERLVSQLRKYA